MTLITEDELKAWESYLGDVECDIPKRANYAMSKMIDTIRVQQRAYREAVHSYLYEGGVVIDLYAINDPLVDRKMAELLERAKCEMKSEAGDGNN